MGQYYIAVFMAEDGKTIRGWLSPYRYRNGAKIEEHSYLGNIFMKAVETLMIEDGPFHKCRLVWAGDYAPSEPDMDKNLYELSKKAPEVISDPVGVEEYPYIVNHSKKEYIVKNYDDERVHLLSYLVANAEDNGKYNYFGIWSRDIISIEREKPEEYTESRYKIFTDY
jgi:hypothetical protein